MSTPRLRLTSFLMGALAVCALGAPVHAQEPPPPAPPPAGAPSSGPVLAGGAIGLGALQWLSGGGTDLEFVYDQPVFHVEVGLGYDHTSYAGDNTSDSDFRFGVGGWYHLARGSMADFSIGGALRMIYGTDRGGGSGTNFGLEPGAEARVFLSPNFALSGRVGFAITFGDGNQNTTFSLGGQTIGAFGFTYFFR
ncbi:MAG TPA: hypothetical protein VN962_10485 [Polyangia bacterium]|nr:hypothetical protein [Polyangia bacterium]